LTCSRCIYTVGLPHLHQGASFFLCPQVVEKEIHVRSVARASSLVKRFLVIDLHLLNCAHLKDKVNKSRSECFYAPYMLSLSLLLRASLRGFSHSVASSRTWLFSFHCMGSSFFHRFFRCERSSSSVFRRLNALLSAKINLRGHRISRL
jgi:hypothetical protein